MLIDQTLSFRRLGLMMRNDIVINTKNILISLCAILALLLIFHSSMVLVWILFIGGLWMTSLSFDELHNSQKSYYFLTLPASQIEKVLNRWLFTAVLYPLIILLISLPLHNIFGWLKIYLIFQSIFFFGSVYFKNHFAIKTVACTSIFILILSAYLLLLGWIFHTHNFSFYIHFGFLWFVLPIYFWILSYICFIESESC